MGHIYTFKNIILSSEQLAILLNELVARKKQLTPLDMAEQILEWMTERCEGDTCSRCGMPAMNGKKLCELCTETFGEEKR